MKKAKITISTFDAAGHEQTATYEGEYGIGLVACDEKDGNIQISGGTFGQADVIKTIRMAVLALKKIGVTQELWQQFCGEEEE